MTLRPYRPGDLDRLMALWLTSNLSAHPFVDRSYWTQNSDMVRQLLPQSEITVCEADGIIAGFIGITGEGYIAGLFVDEAQRGHGIGRTLIDRAKETHDVLQLHVYRDNAGALRFYLREGFTVVATQPQEETGAVEYHMRWQRT